MIKALFKAQFAQLGYILMRSGAMRTGKKKNGKPAINVGGAARIVLFALLYIFVGCSFLAMFFGMSFVMASVMLAPGGAGAVGYVAIGALIALVLCFVGSVFVCEKQLYEAPDNNLLLAMPIPAGAILACRMLSLYFYNLLFAAVVLIPLFVVLFLFCGVSVGGVAAMLLGLALIPLLSLAITAIISWAVAFISSRLPFKNLVTTVLFLAAFSAYMYFCMNMDTLLQSFAQMGGVVAAAIPPLGALGALAAGSALDGLWFVLWCGLPFAAVYLILSASFFTIVTVNRGARRVKYRARAMKRDGVLAALTKKEIRRFFSMPMYILNCATGSFFQLILCVVLIVKRGDIAAVIAELGPELAAEIDMDIGTMLGAGVIALSCMCCAFNFITAPSISLERDRIWQLKVMPVRGRDVLTAKLACHVIIGFPTTVLLAAVAGVILPLTPGTVIAMLIVPMMMTVSVATWGLCCNLWLPRLDHPSDIVAIKQSGATTLAILCGMLLYFLPIMILCGIGIFLGSAALSGALIGVFALFTALGFGSYIYLGGAKKFDTRIGM